MGRVIHIVTLSTAYPGSTAGLETAVSVLLLAIRRRGSPRRCASQSRTMLLSQWTA